MIPVDLLRRAGASDALILKVLELEQAEALATRREQNRINQQKHRSRKHVIADRADRADIDDRTVSGAAGPARGSESKKVKVSKSSDEESFNKLSSSATFGGGIPDPVYEDAKAKLFRVGKDILMMFGIREEKTGALIGRWLKQQPDPAVLLNAIHFARDRNVAEPIAYISTLISNGASDGPRRSYDAGRAKQEAIVTGISRAYFNRVGGMAGPADEEIPRGRYELELEPASGSGKNQGRL